MNIMKKYNKHIFLLMYTKTESKHTCVCPIW